MGDDGERVRSPTAHRAELGSQRLAAAVFSSAAADLASADLHSKTTVFVAESDDSIKRSGWTRRCALVLCEPKGDQADPHP